MVTAPAVEPVSLAEAKAQMRVDTSYDDTIIGTLITTARRSVEIITGQKLITQTWKYYLDRFPGNYGDFPPPGLGYVFMPAYSFNMAPGTMPLVQSVNDQNVITFPIGPVASVVEVKVYDTAGTGVVWASTNYVVDAVSLPGRLIKKNSASWPVPALGLREANAIEITFTCGYLGSSTLTAAKADLAAAEALVAAATTAPQIAAAQAALAAAAIAVTNAEALEVAAVPEDLKAAIKLLAAHFYMNREAASDLKLEELPLGIGSLLSPYRIWAGTV